MRSRDICNSQELFPKRRHSVSEPEGKGAGLRRTADSLDESCSSVNTIAVTNQKSLKSIQNIFKKQRKVIFRKSPNMYCLKDFSFSRILNSMFAFSVPSVCILNNTK